MAKAEVDVETGRFWIGDPLFIYEFLDRHNLLNPEKTREDWRDLTPSKNLDHFTEVVTSTDWTYDITINPDPNAEEEDNFIRGLWSGIVQLYRRL